MTEFGNQPIPADWPIPAWNADAPVPCYKAQLVRWLAAHYGVAYDEQTVRMYIIVQFVNNRYYPATCPNARGDNHPSTWSIWAFIVEQEKKRRGGQTTLDLEGVS